MECDKKFNWRNFLTQHPIFSSLSEREIDWLICDNVSYELERPEGYEIIKEGELSDSIYLIGSGSVRVFLSADEGSEITLSTLKKGEFFGEIAAIQQKPRSATVIAKEDSVFLEIKSKDFLKIIEEHSDIAYKVLLTLSERLRRDITARKRAEKKLLKSKERYRRIFENLQDVYYEAGIDGTILEVSPSIEKFSLYKRKEFIGKSFYDIYTDPKKRNQFIDVILEKGGANDYEIYLKDKDGSQRPFSITSTLIKDSQGAPLKLVGSLYDISARKKAEQALQESEARYRTLLGAVPDPVVVYGPKGEATYVNDEFMTVYGWSSEELTGKRIDFVPLDETDAAQKAWQRALEDGTVFFETKRLKKYGDLLDVQVRITILRDHEGKHILSIVIIMI